MANGAPTPHRASRLACKVAGCLLLHLSIFSSVQVLATVVSRDV